MTGEQADILNLVTRGDTAGLATALQSGADPDTCDRWGVTALARAAARGDLETVGLLLDRGASVNRTSHVGNSPLMAAAVRGHLEVAKALLAAGADAENRNKWGLGARDWAKWPDGAAEVLALLHGGRG